MKDLLKLVFDMVGFVNTFWGVYATVTLALLGWLFSSKQPWPSEQRIALTTAYCLIVLTNCAAQYRFNILLHAAVLELNRALASNEALSLAFRTTAGHIPLLPANALLAIHLAVDSAVVYLIWIQDRFHAAAGQATATNPSPQPPASPK